MPKRKPTRSQRRRTGRPAVPPAVAPAATTPRRVAVRPAVPAAPERAREPSATRFSARDYTYVRREVRRILVLAAAVLIAIVILSFFLP